MIEVRDLSHRYGPVHAVRDLSFRVEKGQVLGLLGPNGAGKSTTMRAIVGLLTPTKGHVLVGGHDLVTDSAQARRLLGYLPEQVPLYPELTVEEFVSFAGRARGLKGAPLRSAVDRAIETCGLVDMRRRLIGYCSRGYRQRTGLAQALVADPPVLILDEPTVGLDPRQVAEIRDQIEEIARDKAVILSTHILSEASRLCDRVLILDRGICRADDSPEALARALSERPRLKVVARPFAVARARLAAFDGLSIVVETADQSSLVIEPGAGLDAAAVVRALVEAGCAVDEIRPERMGLEEVFLELVAQEQGK
jgi:ABC-2 type transport system ATP-binding protein